MDLEIVIWVVSYVVIPLATAFIGYFLGLRRQKIQSRHNYIIETVKEQYPSLYSEIQRNSEYLDNFLEKPYVDFQFSILTKFLKRGLGSLMKKHHADLFQSVSNFADKIKPKFEELNTLRFDVHKNLSNIWQPHIHRDLLGTYSEQVSYAITNDLIGSVNPYNVLSELLTKKYDSMAKKVEKCYWERTARIREQAGIYEGDIDFENATKSLVELAKPTIENIRKVYAYLKEQNDTEIKGRLLPLLNKYISNPV